MFSLLSKIFGDVTDRQIKKIQPLVDQINSLEDQTKQLTDDQLKSKTQEFRNKINNGVALDELLPEAFAVVREVSIRVLGMRHFDVQLIGGIVLHQGKISEMKTGEGKTLVATLPAYLNGLTGKGVYIVTVNDYLANRDKEWMGKIYEFLGLTVGVIQSGMSPTERNTSYACDITYGTNNEFGFDYLRDNMATDIEECSQRMLNYAIIDEVDSILIDEARTPLIISGMVEDSTEKYIKVARISKQLKCDEHYVIEEKQKNVQLTEEGIEQLEKILKINSLYDIENMDTAHMIVQCLKAMHLFKRDVDYVVKDGEIHIVDEFTGRLMVGRRYSDGLHQAIEAIEGVKIRSESQTLASITFQNYFRMFNKLAGMTGTAVTEEAEFAKIYGLEVIEIPTNEPIARIDASDVIYKTKKEKYEAIVNHVQELNKKGSPVLVGTIAIETSEMLSKMLKSKGVKHHVLNAKYHEKEAEIVTQAGQKGSVTIATNMAGRGTDIKLGEGVIDLGGLHILGTERHESRRIDNQLRGRSGRQGDPGYSRFYVCLEDDLMRLFGSHKIIGIMDTLGLPDGVPIESGLVSRQLEKAQSKVEMHNFEIRKQVLKFDDVMNKQRDSFYKMRRSILESKGLKELVYEMIKKVLEDFIKMYVPEKPQKDEWAKEDLKDALKNIFPIDDAIDSWVDNGKNLEEILEKIKSTAIRFYSDKETTIGFEGMRELERMVLLRICDTKWIDHLHNMDSLRDGIGLRAYAQKDPLVEYKIEGYQMFREMMASIEEESLTILYRIQPIIEPVAYTPIVKNVSYSSSEERVQKQVHNEDKVGRNDPCPCGSGKKYKKCHGQ